MDSMGAALTRVRTGDGGGRSPVVRVVIWALLVALVVPVLMTVFAPLAMADGASEDEDNYSMYKLASNAAGYFSEASEPGEELGGEWPAIAANEPGAAGSLLGYGDSTLSQFGRWLTAGLSGSTQTVEYDALRAGDGEDNSYDAVLAYAQFGAANRDLGLDSMSSSVVGSMLSAVAGSIVWFLYALALIVSMLFYGFIQILKLVNPFMWFYEAIKAINPTFANGMVGGNPPGTGGVWGEGGALSGLSNFVDNWYGLLVTLAWQALVPLFIGFLLVGLVLFKKMDRGGAIKKLIVRIIFIGVGVPLLGSMYTSVLDKFDDSLMGAHSGPTRVVLSTYVDFDSWAMNNRLHVPEGASIGWNADKGQADPTSLMSVRNSALAINVASNDAYSGIDVGTTTGNAEAAWKDGSVVSMSGGSDSGWQAVFNTFGILNRYIAGAETSASDFESGIKGQLSGSADEGQKEAWFTDSYTYGDVENFGTENSPEAPEAPMISTNGGGLKVSGDTYRTFTSTGVESCGFRVHEDGSPISCNLSPLSMYNYLNSSFGSSSVTIFSSENAMSGLVRETHASVSQVGGGPAGFMYWANTVTILGSIVILGIWYAVGMLVGSLRRTFGVIAAVPFATLGAIAAISKVIIYSIAMILEVIMTLFLYQFVSELIIGIPDIIAGPISNLLSEDGLLGSYTLGSIVVVIATFVSTILIIGVTFTLLRVRKQVLQAMDEAVTKLVDKFMETNTAPRGDKGGLAPALASGVGAGAGMAAGSKLAGGFNRSGGGPKPPGKGGGDGGSGGGSPTNAGGLNGQAALNAGGTKTLEGGAGGKGQGTGGPGEGKGDGKMLSSSASSNESQSEGGQGALPSGQDPGNAGDQGQDGESSGGPLALNSGGPGSSASDKETADNLSARCGLSNLGYNSPGGAGGNENRIEGGGVLAGDVAGSGNAQGGSQGSGDGEGLDGPDNQSARPGRPAGALSGGPEGVHKELASNGGTRFGAAAPAGANPQGETGKQTSAGMGQPGTGTNQPPGATGTAGSKAAAGPGGSVGPVPGAPQPGEKASTGQAPGQSSSQTRFSVGQGPATSASTGPQAVTPRPGRGFEAGPVSGQAPITPGAPNVPSVPGSPTATVAPVAGLPVPGKPGTPPAGGNQGFSQRFSGGGNPGGIQGVGPGQQSQPAHGARGQAAPARRGLQPSAAPRPQGQAPATPAQPAAPKPAAGPAATSKAQAPQRPAGSGPAPAKPATSGGSAPKTPAPKKPRTPARTNADRPRPINSPGRKKPKV